MSGVSDQHRAADLNAVAPFRLLLAQLAAGHFAHTANLKAML
jgi:hypothetical protein